jgi:glycosyltransferase involved in cell wall biosynthesis
MCRLGVIVNASLWRGGLLMKIAQIAPLSERVPPKLYGGTERIVSYLTEELVRQKHEVTLFASGDSKTAAELVRCSDMALRLNPAVKDQTPYHVVMLEEVRQRADEFDVLHFHTDLLHFPLIRDFANRTATTLHGRLDLPDLKPFYAAFRTFPWSPYRGISAARCRSGLTGSGTSIMAFRATCCRSRARLARVISPSSAASRPRNVRIEPLRSRTAPGFG